MKSFKKIFYNFFFSILFALSVDVMLLGGGSHFLEPLSHHKEEILLGFHQTFQRISQDFDLHLPFFDFLPCFAPFAF